MTQYAFGAGTLTGVRTDVANSTPGIFGVLQNIEIDFEFDLKKLVGQYQFPVAIARGQGKVSGKASMARIQSQLFNSLFFGQTLSAVNGRLQALNEAATIPTTPFQVTPANAATFLGDLGVFFAATGNQLTRVAAAPTTGQYAVNVATGVYTFATADASLGVLINYEYGVTTGTSLITINNQLMGQQPQFQMTLQETFQSKVINLQLNACVAGKLSMPFTNTDFMIEGFEFEALADAAGIIGYLTTSE